MSTSSFETITYEVIDNIGIVTIDREKKLNALNQQVLTELTTFLDQTSFLDIKGLILTGRGDKSFIAGADISEMAKMNLDEAKSFGQLGQNVTLKIESLSIPVIAAVNGYALGGGCEMAMACDFIYATKSSIFGQPEVKLGLIPGFGGTQRLSRLVGRNRAKELIYTGENLPAENAEKIGLVNKLFDSKEELLEAAKKCINKMAKNSPLAIKNSKSVINDGVDLTIAAGLQKELDSFSSIFQSEDMVEGTNAFMEKRPPVFTGK